MLTAITGGIAEGKSTILAYVAQRGFKTASADDVGRRLFELPEINRELARIAECESPMGLETKKSMANG